MRVRTGRSFGTSPCAHGVHLRRRVTLYYGIRVSVATPRALYRLGKDTVRPLDRQDAEALKQQFDLEEE